ncbi:MAG: poly(R)-hydroxyalkanoic acid synthase [Paucimonas sp.]|jgi:polyhydroxyalkanoate synthase|nr:poly(R)-hydroxyalkanoic acid synthase [Paucimonas sp.]
MNTTHQQINYPQWMTQLANPQQWSAFMQQSPMDFGAAAKQAADMGAMIDPATMSKLQNDYLEESTRLWQAFASGNIPEIKDRRFSAPAWHDHPLHAYNAAMYLLNARFLTSMADAVSAKPKAKQRIRFAVEQMIDAMSPANFLATNPEAQKKILDTNGESITNGIAHMLEDIRKGRITHTDEHAFEVGKNVATTEGAVIYENSLFQLIQYKPLTQSVYERPLLIVPPCINKFYILDLQPANSLVRYAVEEGHTVFLISWRNADESLAETRWDDYVEDAVMNAIQIVQKISKQEKINALGFCIGGTLLATALAVLAARGENPVASLTLLTAFLDFSDTGVIDVFVDEMQVSMREQSMGKAGVMPGREFTSTFSSLRPNDLVWNYVGSNYLKGETPPPFDLLYWNADATNLPGPMFCWYLRNTYLENNLKEPGKLIVAGEKVDLGKINAPAFVYASREDHIVPWQSAYASVKLLNPKKPAQNHFVLGASGHIAGVINPPAKKKRSFWTNDKLAADAEQWLDKAVEHPGSWWTEWSGFLASHAGKKVAAPRKPGSAVFKAIEPAPGRYVKEKSE